MGDTVTGRAVRLAARDEDEALRCAELAHELKNPLSGVKALVQLGLRNPGEAASHGRLAAIEREIERMQEVLRTHLAASRGEAATRARVQLAPLVSEALRAVAERANEAGVRLRARGDAAVEADPRRLRAAVLNLVANGIEATPPGGEVAVEIRSSGETVEIEVRDTGKGIPPEVLERVGTPFLTTRAEGTGLGVALARSALAQHGGSLRYESVPGRGTTARAILPRSKASAA